MKKKKMPPKYTQELRHRDFGERARSVARYRTRRWPLATDTAANRHSHIVLQELAQN